MRKKPFNCPKCGKDALRSKTLIEEGKRVAICRDCAGIPKKTTLLVNITTRDRIHAFGQYNDTIDSIINRALDALEKEKSQVL